MPWATSPLRCPAIMWAATPGSSRVAISAATEVASPSSTITAPPSAAPKHDTGEKSELGTAQCPQENHRIDVLVAVAVLGTTQRSGHGGELSVEHLGVRPGAETDNCGRLHPGQHCAERSGDGGVAYPDLAEGDKSVPRGLKTESPPDGEQGLDILLAQAVGVNQVTLGLPGSRRECTGDRPVADAGIDHDGAEPRGPSSHHAERLTGDRRRKHLAGDVLVEGGDPVGAGRVVGTDEDQTAAGEIAVTQGQDPVDGTVERAEWAGRGQQRVGCVAYAHDRMLVGTPQVRRWRTRRAGAVLRRPPLRQHHIGERGAAGPAGALQARRRGVFVGPTQAQPPQRLDTRRQMQHLGQLGGWDQRHPAHAEAGGSRRQPQILDGTRARPQVGVGVAGPTQDAIGRRATVATGHDTEGSLPDALQLEVQQPSSRVRAELRRLGQPFPIRKEGGPVAGGWVAHHDETPRLAVAD